MLIDRRTVSRKTPRDGKLEISQSAAARLADVGPELRAEWGDDSAPAVLATMTCTCGGDDVPHEHHFLESTLFRSLPVGHEVDLQLDAETVRVAMTPSP